MTRDNGDKEPNLHNPHDKFFRSAMGNKMVAQSFFRHYLPPKLVEHLDLESIALQNTSYLDKELRASVSDLVFQCQISQSQAYVALLVEHQSQPDEWLAFRVYHYLFGFLNQQLKHNPKQKLPPVYALVFYHGEQSPYPFSLDLNDCFEDPLNIMDKVFTRPVPLIDTNQLSDEQLKQQAWVGAMARALKHIRDQDVSDTLVDILIDAHGLSGMEGHLAREFIKTLLHYVFRTGNISNIEHFTRRVDDIPETIRGDAMTIAQMFEARGVEKGREEGRLEGREQGRTEGERQATINVAKALLQQGVEAPTIAKATGLDEATINSLKH